MCHSVTLTKLAVLHEKFEMSPDRYRSGRYCDSGSPGEENVVRIWRRIRVILEISDQIIFLENIFPITKSAFKTHKSLTMINLKIHIQIRQIVVLALSKFALKNSGVANGIAAPSSRFPGGTSVPENAASNPLVRGFFIPCASLGLLSLRSIMGSRSGHSSNFFRDFLTQFATNC